MPIDDHASLLFFLFVASQREFVFSKFWVDSCYCAILLAIVVSFQFCYFVSCLCACRTLPILSIVGLMCVDCTHQFWQFVLSIAMLRLRFCISDPYSDLCNLLLDICSCNFISWVVRTSFLPQLPSINLRWLRVHYMTLVSCVCLCDYYGDPCVDRWW